MESLERKSFIWYAVIIDVMACITLQRNRERQTRLYLIVKAPVMGLSSPLFLQFLWRYQFKT